MNDDQVDARIRGLAADYRRPPATPRDEMWARIQSARQRRRPAVRRPVRWVAWAVGMAAVLAIGIAVGRYTASPPSQPDSAAVATAPAPEGSARSVADDVATGRYLSRVETLLTGFRSDAAAGRLQPAEYRQPARELLVTTRLMQGSPLADNAGVRALLEDVELVLAQITQYSAADGPAELGFIDQGMTQRGVLLKLRSTVATVRATAQGEL